MPKVQAVIGEATKRILDQMEERHLRGTSISEIVSSVLDEWIWHNNGPLKDRGIDVRAKVVKRKERK
jgi:hypothetical protein